MDLMSNMGDYQTKESPDKKEHQTIMSHEQQDFSREEEMSSLPEGEGAVAEYQRWIAQDEVKIVCQGAVP